MKKNFKILIFLHLILFMYSCCGIFSKLAGTQDFFSLQFFIYYGIVLLILFVYAILWQRIIKLLGKVIGAIMIILGIIFYTKSGSRNEVNSNE